MTLSREEFFRDTLIPTGTLVELFMREGSRKGGNQKWGSRVGSVLWDPLNLLNWYILSKQELPALEPLKEELDVLQAVLKGWLKKFTSRTNPVYAGSFHRGELTSKNLSDKVSPIAKRIYALLKYDSKKQVAWFAEHEPNLPPGVSILSIRKWRTFARNFKTMQTAADFGLSANHVKAAKDLSSSIGLERVMTKWYQWFPVPRGTAPGSTETAPSAGTVPTTAPEPVEAAKSSTPAAEPTWTSETLPPYIKVCSEKTGLLEVAVTFDPASYIRMKKDVTKSRIPADLKKRLAPRSKTLTCPYRDLEQTVDEAVRWHQAEVTAARELEADYQKWVDAMTGKALVDRLKKTFTDDEIPLLLREMTRQQDTAA